MTKFEQQQVNEMCETELKRMTEELYHTKQDWKRLRTCTAWVCETERYYVLQSYGTIIAFIDKATDTLYDVLRFVYGYTATSAQHISKFEKDYCQGQWHCESRYIMR